VVLALLPVKVREKGGGGSGGGISEVDSRAAGTNTVKTRQTRYAAKRISALMNVHAAKKMCVTGCTYKLFTLNPGLIDIYNVSK